MDSLLQGIIPQFLQTRNIVFQLHSQKLKYCRCNMMKTLKGIIGLRRIRKPIRVLKSALGESPFSGKSPEMRGMIFLFPVKPGEDPLKQGSWLRVKMRIVLFRQTVSWLLSHLGQYFGDILARSQAGPAPIRRSCKDYHGNA